MSSLRRTPCLITLVALAALPVFTARAQQAGWTMTLRTDTDSGLGAANRTSTVMRYQTIGDRYRMEFIQATGALGAAEGSYHIFNSADSTMTMVMPAQHMATVTPMTGLASKMSGALPTAGAVNITRRDVTDLGAGPKIAGYATRHFRVALTGTMDWSTPSRACVRSLDSDTEVWIAPDVDVGAAAGAMAGLLSGAELGGASSTGAQLPKGAALRRIERVQRADASGVKHSIATTLEVVELAHGPIPASAFTPPTDYKVMDMGKIMASIPKEMMDSAMAAAPENLMNAVCGSGSR